jgi:hypothetical protein
VITDVEIRKRRLDSRIELIGAWCGPLFVVSFLICFVAIAGFIPPPNPGMSADQVFAFYDHNKTAIRWGQLGCLAFGGFLLVFWLTVVANIREIELSRGNKPILYMVGLISAAMTVLWFQLPPMLWEACTWTREIGSAAAVMSLHVFGWFIFMMPFAPYLLAMLVQGVAILIDDRAQPWLPKWCGYFNLAMVPTTFLAAFVVFFKTGPLAWNGLIAIYFTSFCFVAWIFMMSVMMAKSTRRRQQTLEAGVEMTSTASPMAPAGKF